MEGARIGSYRATIIAPAAEVGLLTEAATALWSSPSAALDARFVAYQAGFEVARAQAG